MQPPDAPLYVKFMKDGYWSMMEFPANRPKVNKPLEQQTTKELFARFDKMGGGWGNYSNSGQVNYRHHKAGLGPGGGENTQERAWRFEGNILVLEGSGPTRSPQIHARKLPNQKLGSTALVGSWERTAYTVNGAAGTTTPEHLLLGEDGWFHATTLPAGRKGVPKVPQDQWTPQQYAGAYNGMSASRGTYNVAGHDVRAPPHRRHRSESRRQAEHRHVRAEGRHLHVDGHRRGRTEVQRDLHADETVRRVRAVRGRRTGTRRGSAADRRPAV